MLSPQEFMILGQSCIARKKYSFKDIEKREDKEIRHAAAPGQFHSIPVLMQLKYPKTSGANRSDHPARGLAKMFRPLLPNLP